ncbi:protein DESIGUAL 2-like [Phragmites australis]|uniref:protein DESIGUAL 2-like n=1 Tax=Phragmites australis TaxID=29695 RepID=UPI002D77F22C|nr:protein DESIGUAL 2-like [Phragmites australis]
MAKVAAIWVGMVMFALDFTAGILAIQAQAAENKVKRVSAIFGRCKEPAYTAYVLGLVAAALLLIAHLTAYWPLNCFGWIYYSELDSIGASINRKLAVLSWMVFGVAFWLLLVGAMSNTKTSCWFIHFDTLVVGGNTCFIHAVITIAYYVTATAAAPEFA